MPRTISPAEAEELRTKCRRWHGAMSRIDRTTFTVLLSSDFSWFPRTVAQRLNTAMTWERGLDFTWEMALDFANSEELQRLFGSIEEYRYEKRYDR